MSLIHLHLWKLIDLRLRGHGWHDVVSYSSNGLREGLLDLLMDEGLVSDVQRLAADVDEQLNAFDAELALESRQRLEALRVRHLEAGLRYSAQFALDRAGEAGRRLPLTISCVLFAAPGAEVDHLVALLEGYGVEASTGVAANLEAVTMGMGGNIAWPALLRKLDRESPGYQD